MYVHVKIESLEHECLYGSSAFADEDQRAFQA